MEILNYILDPGPMALTGTENADGVREAALEHAIRSGMPNEFAVTYAQGRVDAFNQMEGPDASWQGALDFTDGYRSAMRIPPRQKDEEAILSVVGQEASVRFHLLRQPERTVAFKNGFRQARSCINSEHHPRPAQAYAYGYAEGIASIPSYTLADPQNHPADLLRAAGGVVG